MQRENIAEALKRQNKELRHTLKLHSGGKDLAMYAQTLNTPQNGEKSQVDSHFDASKHRLSAKNTLNAEPRSQAKPGHRVSKTPVREQSRPLDDQSRRPSQGRTPNGKVGQRLQPTESDARLYKLIEDYRAENERCTQKINDLKQRLHQPADVSQDKIFAKSHNITTQNTVGKHHRQHSATRSNKKQAHGQNFYQKNLRQHGLMTDNERYR